MLEFNKLVRDNTPQILREKGIAHTTGTLSDEEFKVELHKKLLEEAQEVVEAPTREQKLEELGDLYEVMLAVAQQEGFSIFDIVMAAQDKRLYRGGFSQRIFLFCAERKDT